MHLPSCALLFLMLAGAEPACEPVDRQPSIGLWVYGPGTGPETQTRQPSRFRAGEPLLFKVHPEIFTMKMPPTAVRYQPRECDVATWDFGDGSAVVEVGAREKIEHAFPPGRWTVQLYVTNEIGRSETVTHTIQASAVGETRGGTRVPLRGGGFSGDCRVWFGQFEARDVEGTDGAIVAVAPGQAAGEVDVHVDCKGTRVTLPGAFTYR